MGCQIGLILDDLVIAFFMPFQQYCANRNDDGEYRFRIAALIAHRQSAHTYATPTWMIFGDYASPDNCHHTALLGDCRCKSVTLLGNLCCSRSIPARGRRGTRGEV